MEESCFKTRYEGLDDMKEKGFEDGNYGINQFEYRNRIKGLTGKHKEENLLGRTYAKYLGDKLISLSLVMLPQKTVNGFYETFNHELIHCYDHIKYGQSASKSYRETKARLYDKRFDYGNKIPHYTPYYRGSMDLFDLPTYLVPTVTPKLPPGWLFH